MAKSKYILVIGDILAIAIVTVIGFATHGEVALSFLPRMVALFFPLIVAWFLLAPALGLYQQEITSTPRHLWRPVWAGLFAGTLAVVMRGFLLNAPIIPIFAVIMAGTFALGMVIWRALGFLLIRRTS